MWWCCIYDIKIRILYNSHIAGFVQERRNSIANTLELHLSRTNPSISSYNLSYYMSYPNTVEIGWWIANQCLHPLGPVQRFPPDLPIGIVSGYIINPNGMIKHPVYTWNPSQNICLRVIWFLGRLSYHPYKILGFYVINTVQFVSRIMHIFLKLWIVVRISV